MIFIYSRSKVRDRKILETARRLYRNVKCIDILREKLDTSHFGDLAGNSKLKLRELLDPRIVEGFEITDAADAISLINKKPQVLKTPIVVTRQKVRYISDLTDLQKINMGLKSSVQANS